MDERKDLNQSDALAFAEACRRGYAATSLSEYEAALRAAYTAAAEAAAKLAALLPERPR